MNIFLINIRNLQTVRKINISDIRIFALKLRNVHWTTLKKMQIQYQEI